MAPRSHSSLRSCARRTRPSWRARCAGFRETCGLLRRARRPEIQVLPVSARRAPGARQALSYVCHPLRVGRNRPRLPTPLGQHLTPPRARIPQPSSDFALLCACAHSDATFYEVNSSRTAARSVDCRRYPPVAIAVDHRPSRSSSSIRLRPQLHLGRCFEVCLSRPIPRPTHSLCADRARQGGCTQARRRRTEVERPRSSVTASGGSSRATGGARACGLSRRHGLSPSRAHRTAAGGAGLGGSTTQPLGADAPQKYGGARSHLEQTSPPCVCVSRVCCGVDVRV